MGVQVNAVTKSGTNTAAGSFYGYFRNDQLNAADFVAKRVLPYSNQQMGATFGGPIVKDKFHFFGYYEGEREPQTFIFNSPYPAFNIADLLSTRVEHKAGVRFDEQLSSRTRLMVRANGWKNTRPVPVLRSTTRPIDSAGFSSASAHPSTLGLDRKSVV